MLIQFHKYHGTGNDFVIIDNREGNFPRDNNRLVAKLCHRRFGIGADGLILLEDHDSVPFKMIYYNSDGNLSSMCGNGGRCIAHFANALGLLQGSASFEAVDGMHEVTVNEGMVDLEMNDVNGIELESDYCYMDTGSPHYLMWVENVDALDINLEAHKIRYSDRFKDEGTNVNFLSWTGEAVVMRTYERGVEGETLSCGTGMVAAALYASLSGKLGDRKSCKIITKGGDTIVDFQSGGGASFQEIHLIGPTVQVFNGSVDV